MTRKLEPIEPDEAIDLYLAQKEQDASARTVQAHGYRLKQFRQWCNKENIDNMNDMTGRRLYECRLWRKDDGDLNTVSLRTQLCTLRTFIRFCESIDAVESELHDEILLPTLNKNQDSRDEMLESDRAEKIRANFRKFEYASLKHCLFEIFWSTSARLGAVQALDTDDFSAVNQSLAFRHRPKTGTPLKNRDSGERQVAISDEITAVIEDYLEHTRPDVTDSEGREPLIASENGRMSQSNIRALIYSMTRPCEYGEECRCDEKHCYSYASQCEWSRSPHMLRRGSLTQLLLNDVPKPVVSGRADVSSDVLDKHYNEMTESQKMEQRREYLSDI
ncbi:tyrosine-type recombinase/integrase [Halonotius sp. F2-221B]|uniref:tyrosine-type recombinase/integrase n=1 Tax=Halonotius sp. F2-221B TaxID=2731620 RepID=UPI00398B7D24